MKKQVIEVKSILKKTIMNALNEREKDSYIEMNIVSLNASGLENLLEFINDVSIMKNTYGWGIKPIVFLGTDNEVVNQYNELTLERLENISKIKEVPRTPAFKSTVSLNKSDKVQKRGMNIGLSELIRKAQRYDDYRDGFTKNFRTDLDLNIDFQRDLVWTQEQKEILILNLLRDIPIGNFYINVIDSCVKNAKNLTHLDQVLYDGKQRLSTIIEFLNGGFTINYYGEETYCSPEMYLEIMGATVTVYETEFTDKNDLIDYYININTSQTLHSKEDIEKALKLKV